MDNRRLSRQDMRSMKTGNIIGGAVLFIAAGVLLYFGVPSIVKQHSAVTTWKKADGRIVSSSVHQESYRSKGRTRYRYSPRISYSFTAGGQTRSGSSITPVSSTWSQSESYSIVGAHPRGKAVVIYYDPTDMQNNCLLLRGIYLPYLLSTLGVMAAAFGFGALNVAHARLVAPIRRNDGWNQLRPVVTLAHALRVRLIVAAIVLLAIPVQAHFFFVTPGPVTAFAWIGCAGCAAVIAVVMILAARAWSRAGNFSDAVVMVDRLALQIGGEVGIRMELPVKAALLLREVKIGLICTRTFETRSGKKRQVETAREFETWAAPVSGYSTRASEVVRGEDRFMIPANMPPSSPEKKGYPRYDWKLSVMIDCEPGADYEPEYPLLVIPSA